MTYIFTVESLTVIYDAEENLSSSFLGNSFDPQKFSLARKSSPLLFVYNSPWQIGNFITDTREVNSTFKLKYILMSELMMVICDADKILCPFLGNLMFNRKIVRWILHIIGDSLSFCLLLLPRTIWSKISADEQLKTKKYWFMYWSLKNWSRST